MALRERLFRSAPSPAPSGAIIPRRQDVNEVITLCLGDFLDRLPNALLTPGKQDPAQPITFDITKIAKQIIEGRPTIGLIEIYRQAPGIFASEVRLSDNPEIRFPWPKVVAMLRSAYQNASDPGLTRAGALHMARLLRGFTSNAGDRPTSRDAALARAPQWFTRGASNPDVAAESERILEELASSLEQFAPVESLQANHPEEHMETSEAFAITVEENNRLRKEIDERDQEIDSLRKMLADLETAAIDQITALNQQHEEYEIARAKSHVAPAEVQLNPQQTVLIDSLSQQVAELYIEIDRARADALEATAAHAKYREQNASSESASHAMQEYLASVAYELERANAVLKEMEAKAIQTEKNLAAKDAEVERLHQEVNAVKKYANDICAERDALRGRLYASANDRISEAGS